MAGAVLRHRPLRRDRPESPAGRRVPPGHGGEASEGRQGRDREAEGALEKGT